MTIAAWPVAHRSQLVHAYKPGEHADSEARFRTLRKHAWVTSGVRIASRAGAKLAGQLTVFSSLNMEAARLARNGDKAAAVRVAAAATVLESQPEFDRLTAMLTELPTAEARGVIAGVIPDGSSGELMAALRDVARVTEIIREREMGTSRTGDFLAGRVKEVRDGYVLVVLMNGPETLIPRWMAAGAADRAHVGSLLALITDKLSAASAVIDVLPALDVVDNIAQAPFTPYGRRDERTLAITAEDERLLAGAPQQLRILVPVSIES